MGAPVNDSIFWDAKIRCVKRSLAVSKAVGRLGRGIILDDFENQSIMTMITVVFWDLGSSMIINGNMGPGMLWCE